MEPSGLSFSSARDILIQAFKDELSKSSHSTEHLKPSTNGQSTYIYLIVVISIYVFLALLFQSSASYLGALFSILLSSGLIYLDIYVHKHHDHVIGDEVQVELQKILRVYEEDVAGIAAEACEVEEPNVILSGITHSGICTAYRNGKWHRLPSLLLSKGDIVALMAGDLTPGRVLEFLPVEGEAGQRGWSPGAILDAGEKVLLHGVRSAQSASSTHAPPSAAAASERHRILQSDSLELLAISGDVRCFQLLETPITTYLANLMREQAESRNYAYKYPSGLTQLHFILETEKKTVLLTALFLFVVGFIARYFLSRGKILCLELTILHPLLSMLVCFVPCPFVYYFIAEVIATADLLAFMDANLQLNASESSPSANKQPSPLPHLSNHSPFEDDQASNDGFDDADSEERAEEHAEEVSSRLTAQRWIHYFFLVLRSRLGQPAPVSIADLPIPFIHARLLETMGSITFVAFIDDDVVCEGYSIAEELLLLKSSGNEDALDENKGMVLDLHANSQAKGSRFESPSWWKYLRTLKPVGLNSLLTYAPSPLNPSTVTAFRADARLRGGLAGHKSSKNRGKIQLSRMEQQLIAHVRRPMPMESLRELSEEIGFTAMDAAGFTRMLEVNLLVPQLTDRKLLEDMHAWGQDETRRRGMLVPEMRGVVVHDNSSDCLQLLSHGVPAVLLHYCKVFFHSFRGIVQPY